MIEEGWSPLPSLVEDRRMVDPSGHEIENVMFDICSPTVSFVAAKPDDALAADFFSSVTIIG